MLRKLTPQIVFFQYFGGKNQLVRHIFEIMESCGAAFNTLVEPYAGAANVTLNIRGFDKYVINDIDSELYGVYTDCKDNTDSFIAHSLIHPKSRRSFYLHKTGLYDDGVKKSALRFHRALFSFAAKSGRGGSWGYSSGSSDPDSSRITVKNVLNPVRVYETIKAVSRLLNENVDILNRDAFDIFELYDAPSTLFFVDPPYVGTDQSTYASNFGEEELERLLHVLAKLSGGFIFTHYDHQKIRDFASEFNWSIKCMDQMVPIAIRRGPCETIKKLVFVYNLRS